MATCVVARDTVRKDGRTSLTKGRIKEGSKRTLARAICQGKRGFTRKARCIGTSETSKLISAGSTGTVNDCV